MADSGDGDDATSPSCQMHGYIYYNKSKINNKITPYDTRMWYPRLLDHTETAPVEPEADLRNAYYLMELPSVDSTNKMYANYTRMRQSLALFFFFFLNSSTEPQRSDRNNWKVRRKTKNMVQERMWTHSEGFCERPVAPVLISVTSTMVKTKTYRRLRTIPNCKKVDAVFTLVNLIYRRLNVVHFCDSWVDGSEPEVKTNIMLNAIWLKWIQLKRLKQQNIRNSLSFSRAGVFKR